MSAAEFYFRIAGNPKDSSFGVALGKTSQVGYCEKNIKFSSYHWDYSSILNVHDGTLVSGRQGNESMYAMHNNCWALYFIQENYCVRV